MAKLKLEKWLEKLNEAEVAGPKATFSQAGVKQTGWQEIIPDNVAKIFQKWRVMPKNKGQGIKQFLEIVGNLIHKKQLYTVLVPQETTVTNEE